MEDDGSDKKLRSETVLDFDWVDALSFLFTLSQTPKAQMSLCAPRFLSVYMQLLQYGNPRIQLLTLRLFRRIFPRQNPENLMMYKGKSLISSLFETIGSINCLYEGIDKSGICTLQELC
jgi:hypothetical protein